MLKLMIIKKNKETRVKLTLTLTVFNKKKIERKQIKIVITK